MNNDLKYWVGVSGFAGLGIKRFELLRNYFGSIKKIYLAPKDGWTKIGISADMADAWDKWRRGRDLDADMRRLETAQIKSIKIKTISKFLSCRLNSVLSLLPNHLLVKK